MTDDEQTSACPDCDSTHIHHNTHSMRGGHSDDEWRCRDCNAGFDEPDYRPPRNHREPNGLAGQLSAADADDFLVGGDADA